MTVPKIIHQIWIGPYKKPSIWTDTFEKDYISANPGWEYKLWTDENIDELLCDFPIIEQIYDTETTYNGKSDLLRYLILYQYGGIYIDADSVWVNNKNFDDLLSEVNSTECFVAFEPSGLNICGGVMGSSKNNEYIKLLMEGIENIVKKNGNTVEIKKYIRIRSYNGVCKVIGPNYIDRMCKTFDQQITIFPSIYFYPVTWHGVNDMDQHLKMDIPKESYTFQYGYTTNHFKNKM